MIGQYRGKANLHGSQTSRSVRPGFVGANNYTGSKSEWVVMANAYVDLGTWWCITPFIGAGVGGSYNKHHRLPRRRRVVQHRRRPTNSVTYFADNGKWNFAWAAHAGLAYKVNPGFTVELAYSYMDLGDAAPGNFRFVRQQHLAARRRSRSRTSPRTTSSSACAGISTARRPTCRRRSSPRADRQPHRLSLLTARDHPAPFCFAYFSWRGGDESAPTQPLVKVNEP